MSILQELLFLAATDKLWEYSQLVIRATSLGDEYFQTAIEYSTFFDSFCRSLKRDPGKALTELLHVSSGTNRKAVEKLIYEMGMDAAMERGEYDFEAQKAKEV